jgi:hypothetical protein
MEGRHDCATEALLYADAASIHRDIEAAQSCAEYHESQCERNNYSFDVGNGPISPSGSLRKVAKYLAFALDHGSSLG